MSNNYDYHECPDYKQDENQRCSNCPAPDCLNRKQQYQPMKWFNNITGIQPCSDQQKRDNLDENKYPFNYWMKNSH